MVWCLLGETVVKLVPYSNRSRLKLPIYIECEVRGAGV